VLRISPCPEKRLPRHALEPQRVDRPPLENLGVELREVVAHHSDKVDRREEARCHRKICGRASHDAVHFSVRTLQSVERNRTYDEQGHSVLLVGVKPDSYFDEIYLPMISESCRFVDWGTTFKSVIRACASAEPHLQPRVAGIDFTACRITRCAFSAFWFSVAMICAPVTDS